MAGRRTSLVSLAGQAVETVPGASRPDLIHVHPDTVAPTPLNPRRAFDESELAELGEDMRAGQLQPCVAVARSSYLKLYPEHADRLPDGCRYVMAAGERRWRAALKVGLDSLDVMLRHDLTESRIRFLAAVLSENVQRANFNPIEEADGLRAMLDLHDGNQAAAARAMGKSKAWFNQRIGLLRLSDEMVQLVLEGTLTAFRDMRRYAALPPEEQHAAWKRDQEQPRPPAPQPVAEGEAYTAVYAPEPSRSERAVPGADNAEPVAPGEGYTAVYASDGPAAAPPAPGPVVNGTPRPQEAPSGGIVPEPRDAAPPAETEAPGVRKPGHFPYDDGELASDLLIGRMQVGEFDTMLARLNRHQALRDADAG